jgi:PAS domain S-box-containing protein
VRGSVGAFSDITEHKQAEEALRESEEKYRNLVETANEGILVIDAGHRITYINEKMAEMLGYSRKDIIGKSVRDFTDEAGKAVFETNMKKRQQGINEIHEFRFISKDGLPLWTLVNSKSLFDKDGKFVGSMSMLTDITKRKEAETKLKETLDNLENLVKERTVELEQAYKSLKESEKGLAEAQRMAHIGNWEWNRVTGETYWSDELYRIFERNPQESAATYSELLNYIHPGDRDYVCSVIKKGLTGETTGIDYRIVLANGEERTVHAQAEVTFDEINVPLRVKGIAQDITERKKAEQAIESSEERYRIITEQTGQLVYDYSLEEDNADWAGNIEELTGYTPDEFRGMNLKFWLSCIHPEDQNTLLEKYEKCLVSGETYRMEYRFRKKNKEYIYFEDNGIFLRDKKGDANRVLGAVKDITERKKAEMFVANVETARKKEIHHRIKNNLQVISSLLDLQSEKFKNRESVEDSEVLKAFRESQDRVMSIALIHEELHEGKGTDKLNFSPYLERLVNSLFQTYRLGNTNTNLNIELEENIFFDMDIAVPLGIIINELVSNSLKYAFSGKDSGLIQFKLCREKSTEHVDSGSGNRSDNKLGSEEESYNNSNFVLTVSDNGIGIPENFNSENSGSLGLQLVMILVDQLEGKLEMKRNNGTEFTIRFTVK